MKKLFFLLLFLTVVFVSHAQEAIDGRLIAKLKPEYRSVLNQPSLIYHFAQGIPGLSFGRKFPGKQPLDNESMRQGFPLTDLSLIYDLHFEDTLSLSLIKAYLSKTGYFEYVEEVVPPQHFQTTVIPDDPKVPQQYYLKLINAYRAWEVFQGDSATILGLVDTGTDLDHTDLVNKIAYNLQDPLDSIDNDNDGYVDNYYGWDLGEGDREPEVNKVGHGAHVSGIMAAEVNNNEGIAGVGFHSRFLPVKVDDQDGYLTMAYEGIVYAADHGADVINCSWGSSAGAGQYGQDIINYATFNKDALVVAAAGNSNNEVENFPASYEHVLSVAATDRRDQKMRASTFNNLVDIAAPGHRIYSTWVNNNYVYSSGTSMAAPMVTAAAGLLRAKYPHLSALQVGELLRVTARDIYDDFFTRQYRHQLGKGVLDMYAALTSTANYSVRFSDVFWNVTSSQSAVYDTLEITGNFTNYLSSLPLNSTVVLRCNHPSVVVLDSLVSLGGMTTLSQQSNVANPFRIMLLPNLAKSEKIHFQLHYKLDQETDYQYFSKLFNMDYRTLYTGNYHMTFSSNGKSGYHDDVFQQGVGLLHYNLNTSMLSAGGLLLGISSSRVSDRIYGDQGFDDDFVTTQPLQLQDTVSQTYYEREYVSEFDDSNAGTLQTGLAIKQRILDWTSMDDQDYFVLEYTVTNPGNVSVQNIYAGYYMDWDVHFSHKNRCEWDAGSTLSYVYDTDGYGVGGLSLLKSSAPVWHYAFDHDGYDNSIELNDGFGSFEKWQALQSNRDMAGFENTVGNDVSHLLSSGPYSLNPGDSFSIAYAIAAGNNFHDIEQAVKQADYRYNNVSSLSHPDKDKLRVSLYPNPTEGSFMIRVTESGQWTFDIYSVSGQKVDQGEFFGTAHAYNYRLQAGVYFLRLFNKGNFVQKKLVIQ